MKCTRVLLIFLLLSLQPALATGPAPASDILDQALKSARSSKKAVFAGFHASWCGYCRRLERFLSAPEVKPIFERNFETAWFTALERGEKKALENPGVLELMEKWGGSSRTGLPFFALLDSRGSLIGTSLRPVGNSGGENIGYPGTPAEIDHFLSILKRAGKSLTPADLEVLRRNLSPPPAPR